MSLPRGLRKLVFEEGLKIRKFATRQELNQLDPEEIDAWLNNHCIYGQMTGFCRSSRAVELINQCAVPYSVGLSKFTETSEIKFGGDTGNFFSPIEFYIAQIQDDKSNEERIKRYKILVAFLRGTRQTIW